RKSRQPARKRTPATAPRQVRPAVAAAAAAAAHAPLTVTVAESAGRVQVAAEPARTGWGTRVHPSTAPALPSGEPALPSADSGLGSRESVLPSGESGLPSREPADHEQVSSGEPADVPSASSVRELRLVRDPVREEPPSEPESHDEAAPRRPRQSAGARPIDTEALRRLRQLAASADGTSADTARPERSGEDEAARRQHRKGQPPRLNPALLADAQRSWAPLTPDSRPITLSRPLHDHGPEPTFPTRRDDTSKLAPEDSPRDATPSGEPDGAEERPDRSEPETDRGGTRRRGLRVVTTEQEAHPQQAEQPAEEPAPADHQQTGDTTPEGQVAPPEDERAGDGKASRGGSAEDALPATSRGAGRKRAARGAGTEEKVAPSESGRAASEEPERVAGAEVSRGESAEDAGDARSAASPGATRGRDAGAERRGRRAEAARDGAERRQTAWANAGRDVGGERGEVPSDGVSPETAQGERAGEPVGRQVGRADGLIDGGVVVPGPRAGEARVRR